MGTDSEVVAAARETKPKNTKVEEDETFGDGQVSRVSSFSSVSLSSPVHS